MTIEPPPIDANEVERIVAAFEAEHHKYESDGRHLVDLLVSSPELRSLIHSVRTRVKESEHLREKLARKHAERWAEGKAPITAANYKVELPDLVGVRILHLRMQQMREIHTRMTSLLESEGYVFAEPPEAKTWDPEYKQLFDELKINTKLDESMYTSVHYVLAPNKTCGRLCELQVRTLAEEVWGEVSHLINYPTRTQSVACQEQLKVLARVVSGCTRLVDSLFASHAEFKLAGDGRAKAADPSAQLKPAKPA